MQRTKDYFLIAAVVLLGILAVSGDGFSDYANKPFWWHFWGIAGWVALLALIVGWFVLYLKSKNNSDQPNG